MSDASPIVHATLVARRGSDGWRGALLRGASGCGKSTLALKALEAGFRLVADDRVLLWTSGGRVFGRAPASLSGLIEVRHVDVTPLCALRQSPVDLVVDLDGAPERLAEGAFVRLAGHDLPRLALRPFETCAPSRLSAALDALPARD